MAGHCEILLAYVSFGLVLRQVQRVFCSCSTGL